MEKPYTLVNKEVHEGDPDTLMEHALSVKDGGYIGSAKDAEDYMEKFGITEFYKTDPDHNTCSLGWNPKENKWYGWSHRAIYGFTIGSKVEKGSCGYQASNKEEFAEQWLRWHQDDYHESVSVIGDVQETDEGRFEGIEISYKYNNEVPNKKMRGETTTVFYPFPKTWGRGEWEAKTMEDAKQMAIDFAESVS